MQPPLNRTKEFHSANVALIQSWFTEEQIKGTILVQGYTYEKFHLTGVHLTKI